jgi:hypothetical protein
MENHADRHVERALFGTPATPSALLRSIFQYITPTQERRNPG